MIKDLKNNAEQNACTPLTVLPIRRRQKFSALIVIVKDLIFQRRRYAFSNSHHFSYVRVTNWRLFCFFIYFLFGGGSRGYNPESDTAFRYGFWMAYYVFFFSTVLNMSFLEMKTRSQRVVANFFSEKIESDREISWRIRAIRHIVVRLIVYNLMMVHLASEIFFKSSTVTAILPERT